MSPGGRAGARGAPAGPRPASGTRNRRHAVDSWCQNEGGPGSADWWFRRQLVMAGVAAVVVLLAVAGAGFAIDRGRDAAAAALRPTADGRGVIAVSPAAESTRAATWVVAVAVVAVAAVLTVLLDHTFRVARFAVLARPGRAYPEEAAAEAAQEEPRAWP
ncbi:MAG TPA: hypothetical protein VM242_01395 [Acidimicrobiales bacterium]|nr:hypothetical protein [Acidimicrobiales bacterium]